MFSSATSLSVWLGVSTRSSWFLEGVDRTGQPLVPRPLGCSALGAFGDGVLVSWVEALVFASCVSRNLAGTFELKSTVLALRNEGVVPAPQVFQGVSMCGPYLRPKTPVLFALRACVTRSAVSRSISRPPCLHLALARGAGGLRVFVTSHLVLVDQAPRGGLLQWRSPRAVAAVSTNAIHDAMGPPSVRHELLRLPGAVKRLPFLEHRVRRSPAVTTSTVLVVFR
jgi:hypothetical protein